MAVTNPAGFLQNAGATHNAEIMRNVVTGWGVGAVANGSMVLRGGVNPSIGNRMNVGQQGSPTMGIAVGSGTCYVSGTQGSSQGLYGCMAPTSTNVAVTAAHATLPRIDIVVARVYDSAYSGVTNLWALEVIAGTPAASPAVPATPANSLILAQIAVGAAVTTIVNANITDRRTYIAQGIVPVSTFADLSAVLNRYSGMTAYVQTEDTMYTWNGTTWIRPYDWNKAVMEVVSPSSTGAIGTSQTVYTTLGSATYKANTAYKIEMQSVLSMSTTGAQAIATVKKTDAAGQQLADFSRSPQGVSGAGFRYNNWAYFTVGGSDVTAVIVGCIAAGTGTVTVIGASQAPRVLRILEAGKASDYANWPVLV